MKSICVICAVALLATDSARADVFVQRSRDDVPVVKQITPLALVPGTETTVTIIGERLGGLHQIVCGEKVRLKQVTESSDKKATLVLQVDEAAKPGAYPIHVLCKAGLSNPRLLRLDSSPKCVEKEGNNSIASANSIEIPCGVCGTLANADRDVYSFQVATGETLTFDLHASRLGSPLRGRLTLLDDQGRQISREAASSTCHVDEPLLVHHFTKAGRYFICISDLTYQGADYCGYYLRAGTFPVATEVFPLGGQRGTKVDMQLSGGNLPQPRRVFTNLDEQSLPNQRRVLKTDGGYIEHSLAIAAGNLPEQNEDALTRSGDEMDAVTWPCTINGRVGKPSEADVFPIQMAANQKVRIRVLAQRLGSPLDSVLSIKGASGKELATADDTSTKDWQPPAVRDSNSPQICDDSEVQFTAPRAGVYTIELTDRFRRGGSQFAYRLEVDQPSPDFTLMIQPGNAVVGDQKKPQNRRQQVIRDFYGQGTGSLSIDKGGRGTLIVKLLRRDYGGPVELQLSGLPTGLHSQPTKIAAGQNQAELVLYADFEAPSTAKLVTLTGTARIGDKDIVRRAAHPVTFASTPLGGAVGDELDVIAIGISQQGAKLAMRGTIQGGLVPGSKSRLVLDIRRREGIVGEVKVKPSSLPTGLSVPSITLPEKENHIEIELVADVGLLPGSRILRLEAQLQPKPVGKKKAEPLMAIAEVPLEIVPLVTLQNATQQVEVARGKQASVTIEISRAQRFDSQIELTPDRLPKGVTIKSTTIAGGADKFEIVFQAASDAAASPIRRVVQLKPMAHVGEMPIELPPLRFALKVTKQ